MTDNIDIQHEFDDFLYSVDEEVTALTNRIESIALEKGKTVIRSVIRELFEDVVEEIFDSNFIDNKRRKIEKWFKRRIKGIFR
jgi:hypothetical protein